MATACPGIFPTRHPSWPRSSIASATGFFSLRFASRDSSRAPEVPAIFALGQAPLARIDALPRAGRGAPGAVTRFLLLFFFIARGGCLDLALLGANVAAAPIFSRFVLVGTRCPGVVTSVTPSPAKMVRVAIECPVEQDRR